MPTNWPIGGMERSFEQPKHLEKRMKPVRVSNDGWTASADNNKLGYEATKNGATFEIKLPVLEETLEIQTLNFMVMTSYGEKWKDSKIAVDVYIDRAGTRNETVAKTMDILGYHDRNTSENGFGGGYCTTKRYPSYENNIGGRVYL
eukprot:CAMPEP_0178936892 /NCGR_PEP_ID=MMETSP0786-20121207/25438_1 /TAXON_ID=186022 /ORGANISM="Thalassionema frauenfeldii, Strain CCMP 1798" /LENGTH=145 /DNA_ID=CAMNT_0020615371 /DNA_START=103 /DNA_END=540 /DNA_ORIENTATION=+